MNIVDRVRRRTRAYGWMALTWVIFSGIEAFVFARDHHLLNALLVVPGVLFAVTNARQWRKGRRLLADPFIYLAALNDEFGSLTMDKEGEEQ